MVLYEYKCPNCGTFTISVPRGAQPRQATCPTCGELGKRVFSLAGVHFHGPGFTRPAVDPFRTKEGRKPDYALMEERAMENAHKEQKAGLRED